MWPKNTKKMTEPIWKISTKVVFEQTPVLLRKRKKKSNWGASLRFFWVFLGRYFRTVWWIVFTGLITTFLVVLFTTPIFSLKASKIEIILDPEPVFDRTAVVTLLRDFVGKNIFRLSTTEIFTVLESNIRHIQSVEKTLVFPDGIRVRVKSFAPIYRAYIGDDVFLLTQNWQFIIDIPEIETSSLKIHNLVSDTNGMRNTTLSTADTFVIQEIEKIWYKELPNFPIEWLSYYDQEKEFHITSKWTRFIFTLSGGIDQLQTLAVIIRGEQISPARALYIDARVPRKIYICPRDDSRCATNLRNIYDL